MTDSTTIRWRRDPHVLWRRSGLGLVLLPPTASECIVASGSAWPVWHHLENPVGEEELHAALSVEFGMDEDAVANGIQPLLDALRDCGAIVAEQP